MLEVRNLSVSYGGILALRGASIDVARGEIAALVGSNGAGKTTLLNAASGLVPTSGGSVYLDGEELTGRAAHRISRAGLIQVPEGRRVLGPMTVEENLDVGRQAAGPRAPGSLDRIYTTFPILAERRQQLASSLSGGQQQMLAIGRALMANPRLLMLDEPSLGLAPIVAEQVFDALIELNRDGLTILVVEQNARRALAVSSRAFVLEKGGVVKSGKSEQLARDPSIIAHYLGTSGRPADSLAAQTNDGGIS